MENKDEVLEYIQVRIRAIAIQLQMLQKHLDEWKKGKQECQPKRKRDK